MAYIELYSDKLKHNYKELNKLFNEHGIKWAVVAKLLCGNTEFLKEVVKLGTGEVCDSRISNLKTIKKLNPNVETVYIKPPSKSTIKAVVTYADASFNTELVTIRWIAKEAKRQNKLHQIIIMIELGDLREGVMGDELLDFYEEVFMLPNIKVTGIGANLNCLSGVYPSEDKLIQLSLYKQLIETTFKQKIPWVTGGTSVVIPMLSKGIVPKGINHFRVGESLFFGNDLTTGKPLENMKQDVFKLFSQIIEIHKKPKIPTGYLGDNPSGDSYEINEEDYGKTSYRAIIDVGVLDVSKPEFITPEDKSLKVIGASSDMLVIDLGNTDKNYHVGDILTFKLSYMGALRLFNSSYIDKKVIT